MAHENTALFHLRGVLAHVSVQEIKLDLIRMLKNYTQQVKLRLTATNGTEQ